MTSALFLASDIFFNVASEWVLPFIGPFLPIADLTILAIHSGERILPLLEAEILARAVEECL